ncbi:hypothetical protein Scep_030963 [Stephania cephalantha]|uniref:Uncharacterized protein n=1 Tax=Stephania cephalantha TaxID=152367 RepID=A0AAP0HH02_9MAGN
MRPRRCIFVGHTTAARRTVETRCHSIRPKDLSGTPSHPRFEPALSRDNSVGSWSRVPLGYHGPDGTRLHELCRVLDSRLRISFGAWEEDVDEVYGRFCFCGSLDGTMRPSGGYGRYKKRHLYVGHTTPKDRVETPGKPRPRALARKLPESSSPPRFEPAASRIKARARGAVYHWATMAQWYTAP